MFRYGGPIKEGIMHGMKNGGTAGVGYGLVGDQRYPKTGGREHHWIFAPWLLGAGARLAIPMAARKIGSAAAGQAAKSAMQGGAKETAKNVAKNVAGAGATGWKNIGKNWFSGDPLVKGSKWGWKTLTSPGANTLAQKTVKMAISPTSIIGGVAYYMWPDGKERKTPPPGGATGPKPWEANEGMYYKKPPVTKSAEELAAEAKAARTKRLNKYLDIMGYDKAKSNAMADALIDASAIVQAGTDEAGSLKRADWGKMINQAIQTTSKRLDKPEQIREAVGLMMTKADIQKDMTAEENALAKLLKRKQIEKIDKDLKGNSFAENKVLTAKTVPGQAGFDAAVELTEGKNFKGNLIPDTEWIEVLTTMQDDPASKGLNEKQLIESYVNAEIAGKGYQDGHYTVGDNLVEIKDSVVISVE